nr:uncharacterized protein LOC125420695 [Ziziphus jujuba var. spinosa]
MEFRDLMSYLNCLANPSDVLPVRKEDNEIFFLYGAITLEHLWWLRNRAKHEGEGLNVDHSSSLIHNRVRELIQARDREEQVRQSQEINLEHSNFNWRKPPEGSIKLNSDVAVRTDGSVLASVARYSRGIVLNIHIFKSKISIPEVAELEAIGKAVEVAHRLGWTKVIMEFDAQLVRALNNRSSKTLHSKA